MSKFRKKPVVIEARLFGGTQREIADLTEWSNGAIMSASDFADDNYSNNYAAITTLEGTMTASPGDWIIRGISGEFYPCKPEIFEATYELIEDGAA